MKPNEPDPKELEGRHSRPSVIVGIGDNKTGEPEEEIDCQVGVVHQAQRSIPAKRVIEDVKDNNQDGRTPSQSIQYFKVLFTGACPVSSNRITRLTQS